MLRSPCSKARQPSAASASTDGTEAAATGAGPAGCITFTALYPGSLGDLVTVTLAAGSKAGSWAAIIGLPGLPLERFDNIDGHRCRFLDGSRRRHQHRHRPDCRRGLDLCDRNRRRRHDRPNRRQLRPHRRA